MKSTAFQSTPLAVVALGLIAGCGGGSGNGSSNVQGSVKQGSAGMSTFSFLGSPKPLVTESTGQVTSVTMAGASFTNLALHPNPTLQNTNLLFSMTLDGEDQIYKFNYPNGPIQTVTNSYPGYYQPIQSKFGDIFCTNSSTIGCTELIVDGTHLKPISTNPSQLYAPSLNPACTLLAFDNGALFTCPVAGGTATQIQGNVTAVGTSWSPAGNAIAYVGSAAEGQYNLLTTPVAGGPITEITPPALASDIFLRPSWSPNGVDIAAQCIFSSNNNAAVVIVSAVSASNTYVNTTPAAYSDLFPVFSPDGSKIAFYRTNTGGATPGIYVEDASGLNQQMVTALPSGVQPESLSWSPFPSPVTFVPNSSFNVNPISGFVLTQTGAQFGSLLGFTAKTPSAATITGSATQGSQPLAFTLSADAITNIVYTNGYFTYATAVTPPASTPSALVTVDASTGAIDMVATAATPHAKFAPAATRSIGSNLVYDGPFTAVYGPKGNRLDTNGAGQVVVDGKTGKLVSFN